MERPPRIEQPVTPEKSKEELYLDALKAKREVLSSHYSMNQLRKSIDRRIEEIPEDKLKEDPEVQQYELVKKEYDRYRELLLASVDNLSEDDSQKISELTSLTKVENALSLLAKPSEVEVNSDNLTPEEFSQKEGSYYEKIKDVIMGANRISGGSETVESRMSALGLRKEALESLETENMIISEVNKMIKYSIDTARPLELAYWESRRRELKHLQKTEPKLEQEPTVTEKPEPPKVFVEPKLEPEPESVVTENIEHHQEAIEQVVSIEQKDAVDHFIEQGEGAAEVVTELMHKENVDGEAINNVVEEALGESGVLMSSEKIVPPNETFLKKIRDRIKNKAVIYVGVGLLALMAWNSETREHLTKSPTSIVKILDKVPDIQIAVDFPKMVANETARYRMMPYLVARYVGSNDYFGLEAIKAANAVGLEGAADGMYENALSDYINNFSETRQANRFTTLDKHTVRNYIDTFTQIYTGREQSENGIKTYQKLRDFLQTNFGAAKVYELALKVSSEKNLSPELLASAKDDLRKQEVVLGKAIGKSRIYFNQEEGVFNVIHDGQLIDTYASRAGFMNVPEGKGLKSLGYERTPDGKFTISSIEYGYSTLRWRDSFLPYGAELRVGKSGEIEYEYRSHWYPATGSEATYFDQGQKVKPNKSEKDLKYLSGRSKGELPLTKSDFYSTDGLMTHWSKNPFGPIAYKLAGRAELIHSNPTDSDNILHPSHGCIRLDKEDVKTLESYVGKGVSKIKISSEAGETWSSVS